jgi:hypothetical protein
VQVAKEKSVTAVQLAFRTHFHSAGWFHVKLCAKCTAVTDSFFAICRTHQLLCCGSAISKLLTPSGVAQQRSAG